MADIYSPSAHLIGVALDVKYRSAIGSRLALMTVKVSRRSCTKQSSAGSAETLVSNYLFKHWDFAFVSALGLVFLLENASQPYASIMYKIQTTANQITPSIAFRLAYCSAQGNQTLGETITCSWMHCIGLALLKYTAYVSRYCMFSTVQWELNHLQPPFKKNRSELVC